MWWPRKPQPPITRTLPRDFFWGVGIGAIVRVGSGWERSEVEGCC